MNVFTKNGISIDNFRRVPHPSSCVHLFGDTCLTRDYPKNPIEDVLFFARIQTENLVKKFLSLFGVDPPKRPVPVDPANFFLNSTTRN